MSYLDSESFSKVVSLEVNFYQLAEDVRIQHTAIETFQRQTRVSYSFDKRQVHA
jgi:hypothetical protein